MTSRTTPRTLDSIRRKLRWTNDDVDMMDWKMPEHFDANVICHDITYGPGWVLLKGMFSEKDIEMARERLLKNKTFEDKEFEEHVGDFLETDDRHNNFDGLTWGLLSRGKIFAKIATHPVILEISRKLLGENCRLSSLAANTVRPGKQAEKLKSHEIKR